jgi:hypothetical protein
MTSVGVSNELIKESLNSMKTERVLPFRFITAARYAPFLEPSLEVAMFRCLEGKEKLKGKTILLVDVSGSMDQPISAKSEMTRMDGACGLAVLARELCDEVNIYTFSNNCVPVPTRRGFALRDAIINSQLHSCTYLGKALESIAHLDADRLIIFTDEQSHDRLRDPLCKGYVINVASYQNGVGYGAWNHVDGFSEAVFDFIIELERENV